MTAVALPREVEEETFERFLACSKGFCLLQLRGGLSYKCDTSAIAEKSAPPNTIYVLPLLRGEARVAEDPRDRGSPPEA